MCVIWLFGFTVGDGKVSVKSARGSLNAVHLQYTLIGIKLDLNWPSTPPRSVALALGIPTNVILIFIVNRENLHETRIISFT